MFAVTSLMYPTKNFNIMRYITLCQSHSISSTNKKLTYPMHTNNINRHFYFYQLSRLWNVLPIIDLNQSITTIKPKLKADLWKYFLDHFTEDQYVNTALTILYVCVVDVTIPHVKLTLTNYSFRSWLFVQACTNSI